MKITIMNKKHTSWKISHPVQNIPQNPYNIFVNILNVHNDLAVHHACWKNSSVDMISTRTLSILPSLCTSKRWLLIWRAYRSRRTFMIISSIKSHEDKCTNKLSMERYKNSKINSTHYSNQSRQQLPIWNRTSNPNFKNSKLHTKKYFIKIK